MDYQQETYPVSGARAYGLLHLAVSSYYYQSHGLRDETPVRAALRLLTVHDNYTRKCLWIEADASLSDPRVARVLDCVAELLGRHASLITDNGPEFAGLALERWAHDRQVHHLFITPSKPSQNGYIESFNGKNRRG